MSDGDFEDKIRGIFKEVSQSIEQAAESIDLDEIADRIGMSSERFREFAETAGQWLSDQFFEGQSRVYDDDADGGKSHRPDAPEGTAWQSGEGSVFGKKDVPGTPPPAQSGQRRGPHPRDLPTEEQGLALSALDSGRWKVNPGTTELISGGEGPGPGEAAELVGELRARDWIAASGEVTLVGRDALRRWLDSSQPS